jgi:hypothetical protein
MKAFVCGFLLVAGCAGSNPNRDLCVGGAKLEYYDALKVCKEKQLSYSQCNERYEVEKNFQKNQEACR